jgi:hypothetical protein
MNLYQYFPKLTERKIKLSSLNIPPRVFNNWQEKEVVYDTEDPLDLTLHTKLKREEPRRMYLFNAFEALWLLIVKELRTFNLGLGTIRELKRFMIVNPFDDQDNKLDYQDYDIMAKTPSAQLLVNSLSALIPSIEELKQNYRNIPDEYQVFATRLGTMLNTVLLANHSPSVQIIKKPHLSVKGQKHCEHGTNDKEYVYSFLECYPELYHQYGIATGQSFIDVLKSMMSNNTVVNIPIKPLVLLFFEDEKLFRHTSENELLTTAELGIIKTLRKGDYKKIILHRNNSNELIIQESSQKEVKNEKAKELRTALGLRSYERAEIIYRNDKHLVINNTRQTKIALSNP